MLNCDDDLFWDPNSDYCVEECPHDYTSDAVYYGHEGASPYAKCVTAAACGLASLFADD